MNARRWALGLLVAWLAGPVGVARSELKWPDTDLSRRVQAWFVQFAGSEDDARAFLKANLSQVALSEASVDARVAGRRNMVARMQSLTPVEVLESTPTHMRVLAKAGSGDEPTLTVEAEEAPPHLIKTITLGFQVGGKGGGPAAPAGPPLSDDDAVREIRKQLDESAASGKFSGAVLLARGGKTLMRAAWGLADREKKTPITPETRFNIASIGKIPTRVAIAQLVAQRKLALDDHLSKYLPDFPHADEITIDMLAAHRSGVGDVFNELYESMDHSKLRHNHDYLQLIRGQPLWFTPGTDERYSNGGYVLLGEVVEKASGMDYYDYLAKNVYEPAGMKATGALVEGDGTPGVARGYMRQGPESGEETDNAASRPARGSAAGGSYSTVDDLLAFDQALVSGRLCSPVWVSWVCEGPRAAGGKLGFGFAGGAPGIASEWEHEGDLVLIVLTNRDPAVTQPALAPVKDAFRRMKS
ncbi:MAG: serine hydrolase domain-containing protein [bacterium]